MSGSLPWPKRACGRRWAGGKARACQALCRGLGTPTGGVGLAAEPKPIGLSALALVCLWAALGWWQSPSLLGSLPWPQRASRASYLAYYRGL